MSSAIKRGRVALRNRLEFKRQKKCHFTKWLVSFQTLHAFFFVIFLSLGKCHGKVVGSLEKVWMDKWHKWQGEGGWMCLALGAKRQQITWPCKTHPLPRPSEAHYASADQHALFRFRNCFSDVNKAR